jgi:hypothetical protein
MLHNCRSHDVLQPANKPNRPVSFRRHRHNAHPTAVATAQRGSVAPSNADRLNSVLSFTPVVVARVHLAFSTVSTTLTRVLRVFMR